MWCGKVWTLSLKTDYFMVWLGPVRRGGARSGLIRHGKVRLGMVGTLSPNTDRFISGKVCQGAVRSGDVW